MNKRIITAINPKSTISEAFRNMRSNISFAEVDKPLKVIAVSSTKAGEGKSTILANYAVTLANTGKRVVIVDCDLRKPMQSKLFDTNKTIGLTNVILRNVALQDAIKETAVKGLYLLPVGPIPPNPSEILGSQIIKMIIESLKENFDYVLIDTPPVGLVMDAFQIKDSVDGYLLVIEIENLNKQQLEQVIESFKNAKVNLIGTVINKAPTRRGGYYYDYYYYYSYSDYYGQENTFR